MEEILVGQKLSGLNSWYTTSSDIQMQAPISKSMGTTTELLKDGGRDVAKTNQQTSFSGEFTNYQVNLIVLYTPDTYPVNTIQLTILQEGIILPYTYCSTASQFQTNSLLTSLTLTALIQSNELLIGAAEQVLSYSTETSGAHMITPLPTSHVRLQFSAANREGKLRNTTLPEAPTSKRRLGPYPKNLMLKPSELQPHCFARDRLQLWHPASLSLNSTYVRTGAPASRLSEEDFTWIVDVMNQAWELDTHETYGSGLLVYHFSAMRKGFQSSTGHLLLKCLYQLSFPSWQHHILVRQFQTISMAYVHGTSCMVYHGRCKKRKWTLYLVLPLSGSELRFKPEPMLNWTMVWFSEAH